MNTILEISNWNQLTKARSEDYENLRIVVKHYNSEELTGTQIIIADYNNNDTYFAGFVNDLSSTLIPTTSIIYTSDMIDIINNFGFNVRISPPIVLADEVITILKGYYSQGYKYLYKDYPKFKDAPPYAIFISELIRKRDCDPMISLAPDYNESLWKWCIPFKTYPIETLIETGTVNNGLSI
jgi:hypothetical protein